MRADAQHNREQILRAARQVFVHEGPDAPMDTIARRAGVGVATLYRRFPSREDLVHAVGISTLQELYEVITGSMEEEKDPFEALRRAMHKALDLKIGAVMPSLYGRVEVNRLFGDAPDAVRPLEALITRAQEAALLRPDIVPGDVIFMIVRLTRPLPGRPFPEDEALAHRQMEIYLDGLRPSAVWPRVQPLPGPAIGVEWFRRIRERMLRGGSRPHE